MTQEAKGNDVLTNYSNLREANIARQRDWCPDQLPDLSFRGNELAGETGEVCNVIKKLERERLGWRGSRDTVEHLAEELADVVICADLVAISAGIDLNDAVEAKFNATSEKVGLPHRLSRRNDGTSGVVRALPDEEAARVSWLEGELADEPIRPLYGDGRMPPMRNGHEVTELMLELAELKLKAAIASSTRNTEIVVKALEWEDRWSENPTTSGTTRRRIMERAMTPFMAYFIEQSQDDDSWWLIERLLGDEIGGPLEHAWQARAAAQADFNTRISSALAAPIQPVTNGWVMVPKEPTEAMQRAAWDACENDMSMGKDWPAFNAKLYRAMLAAAPIPSAPGATS